MSQKRQRVRITVEIVVPLFYGQDLPGVMAGAKTWLTRSQQELYVIGTGAEQPRAEIIRGELETLEEGSDL